VDLLAARLRPATDGASAAGTLAEFVEVYLAQHEGEPETTAKLRWLLRKAVRAFGERRLSELRSPAIAAWRMTVPVGHRFEVTQALRQVLARAVSWGLLDVNPAKLGVENPQRRSREKRPFDSWDELHALADKLGLRHGPMVLFAAATGLRPGEWLALEHRDIDRESRVAYVRRTFRNGRLKTPKTKASVRAVPLQAIALAALDELTGEPGCPLLFPSANGGYFDLHNFRNRNWRPAQKAAGITPLRRVYDLRHTFATFALRAWHLNLRPLPLHGHQSRDDRPSLRPPRPRLSRARDQTARHLRRSRTRRRPRSGRRVDVERVSRRQR
jgi:integrase